MKCYILIFIGVLVALCDIQGQMDARSVIPKDTEYAYQKSAIELNDGNILLFPKCLSESCSSLLIDRIDKFGNFIEALSLTVPVDGDILYTEKGILDEEQNRFSCFLSNFREDSLFLLNVQVNIDKKTTSILQEVYIASGDSNIYLTSPKKRTTNDYIVGGDWGAGQGAFIFLFDKEDGMISSFQMLSQSIPSFGVKEIDVLDNNKYVLLSRYAALGYILDSEYMVVDSFSLYLYDEIQQEPVYLISSVSGSEVISDSMFLVDGTGTLGEYISGIGNHLCVKYNYEDDTVRLDTVSELANPLSAIMYPGMTNSSQKDRDGDIVFVGHENHNLPNYFYLGKYNEKLEAKWHKRFGGDFFHRTHNITVLNNNNIVIYGSVYNYFGELEQQGFYLFLDDRGEVLNTTHPIYEIEDLSVFPNPVTEVLSYTLPDAAANYEIILFDMQGRMLYTQKKVQTNTMDVRRFPSGQYIMQLRDKKKQKIYQAKFQKL